MADLDAPTMDSPQDDAIEENGGILLHRRALHGALEDYAAKQQHPSFGSGEHIEIGDFVQIATTVDFQTAGVVPASFNAGTLNIVKDGPALSYGQIMALAGDLYGIPGHAISDGGSQADREVAFRQVFNTLANANVAELNTILAIMAREKAWIDQELREGKDGEQAAAEAPENFDDAYANATGASLGAGTWDTSSRYMALALTNYDHFGPDAVKAYQAGHAVALKTALDGFNKCRTDQAAGFRMYEQALGYNAFADHFLSDLFAAGHLRTPRRAAAEQHGTTSGSAACKCMHDEDNRWGLYVANAIGEHWKCYGDNHLDTQQGDDNRRHAMVAIRASYNEVYEAFHNGSTRTLSNYQALQQAPDLNRVKGKPPQNSAGEYLNFASAFVPTGKAPNRKIAVRQPVDNRDSHKWKETVIHAFRPDSTKLNDIIRKYLLAVESFSVPKDVLPTPKVAPTAVLSGYNWKGPKTAGKEVRYAFADMTDKVYPDGKAGNGSSAKSPWSQWVLPSADQVPLITIPANPSSRVTRRGLIRQYRGERPEWTVIVYYSGGEWVYVDDKV